MIRGLFPARPAPIVSHEQRNALENPSTPLSNPDSWLFAAFGASPNVSGVPINERTSLSVTAVYACVRIISEAISSLPLITYQRLPRGKARALTHPVYEILHDRPNPEMTAMTFREMLQAHLLTWGNAYAEIETNRAGTVTALWPLLPDRTYPAYDVAGRKVFRTQSPDGTPITLPADRVFHLPGLSFDGLRGYSPIHLAKNAIGLTAAAEQFGSSFFGRGSTPSGVLEHPGKLSPQAITNLRTSWDQMQAGLSGAHRIAILSEGMKWSAMSIPPDHAQFIETRKFQLGDVARIFRVPPHLIADLEKGSSYASVEQMSQDFVTYTLRPWLVRWEQAVNYDLFGARERATVFAEHLVDGLLRGDIASRYQAYAIGRQWGWLSANDVREMENLNALPADEGDIYLVPLNMISAEHAGDLGKPQPASPPPAPPADPTDAAPGGNEPDPADDPGQRAAYVALLKDVGQRMVKRHVEQLRKARKQGEAGWSHAVEAVYREQHEAFTKALTPIFDAVLAFGPPEARALLVASRALADELAAIELTATRATIDAAGFQGIDMVLSKWEAEQPDVFANRGADYLITLTAKPVAPRRVA